MITTSDNIIQETIFDNTELSIHLLKLLGWNFAFEDDHFRTWSVFRKTNSEYPYIERFNNGKYYLTLREDDCEPIYTVKDLKIFGVF